MKVKCNKCNGTGIFKNYICIVCCGNGETTWINNLFGENKERERKDFTFYEEIKKYVNLISFKYRFSSINRHEELKRETRVFMNRMKQKYKFFDYAIEPYYFENKLEKIFIDVDLRPNMPTKVCVFQEDKDE